jgi:hypothetical protein
MVMEAVVAAAGAMVYVNTVVLVQARFGLGEEAVARVLDGIGGKQPEPAEAVEDDAMDLAEMGERIETSFTFTPVAPAAGPAATPPPAPEPVAEDRPLTLFERMMGMSRKPRAPEAPPATLAPQPEPPQASDDASPTPDTVAHAVPAGCGGEDWRLDRTCWGRCAPLRPAGGGQDDGAGGRHRRRTAPRPHRGMP